MGFLFSLFICAFFYQNSSGSFLLSTNLEASDPTLNVAAHRFRMLLGHDYELAPASTQTASGHRGHRFIPSPLVPTRKNHFRGKGHHISTFSHNEPAVPTPSSLSSSRGQKPKGPLSLPAILSHHSYMPSGLPAISPGSSPSVNYEKTLPPIQSMALSPQPTNQECASLTCTKPLTYAPPGAQCGCVWPIEVKLCFSIPLYTFLPLLSNLSDNIAASIPLNRTQVRIMGADAAEQQLDKTTVLFNLVPLGEMFKYTAAFLIYSKFWNKELSIKTLFGAYEVLHVRYPGLPPSPPSWASASAIVDIQPNPSSRDGGEAIKPLGVFVPQSRKSDPGKNMVLMIIVSSVTAFVACIGFLLLLLSKCGCCGYLHRHDQQSRVSSDEKASVAGSEISRSRPSSASVSLSSSLLLFTGTAKVFTIEEIERATDNFNASRILGEGGFGIVYRGILNDGRNVAAKVLKREDQQGSREFLAEVEMLSRLHHRNLVTLLGICPEDQRRCLVYELVPNGSVDSHLHGADKEAGALDWCARMKIALGSARGLAYLHEDSSPRVIHRDFKSSNILLEHDFTPKVSDFGLARTAMEEQNKHISTHVMGTFGYLAPEYAMTGHLLVKSDVYSYGVVLLELITGRKPIDMSRPPGQENLVAWARSLLPTRRGLETIIDPHLKPSISFDTFAKVAAIASMCIQPEVSHRPFMGEVVQALKLVCNEIEETKEPISRSCSYEGLCIDVESKHSITASNELVQDLEKCESMFDAQTALSVVEMEKDSESFRRQFNSAPLKVGRQQSVWQRLRGLSRGSTSEHEYSSKQ